MDSYISCAFLKTSMALTLKIYAGQRSILKRYLLKINWLVMKVFLKQLHLVTVGKLKNQINIPQVVGAPEVRTHQSSE